MESSISHMERYPNCAAVVREIGARSKFQKKALAKLIENTDHRHLEFADDLIRRLMAVANRPDGHVYLAEIYLWYTKLIRVEEAHFAANKSYRYSDYQEVFERVYGRSDYMRDYAAGLGMTQVFWPNHWAIVRYYLDSFLPRVTSARAGAEVGVGHGLFHAELLRVAHGLKTSLLDVSQSCLDFTQRMIHETGLAADRAAPVLCDVQASIPLADASLDVLLMGEIIEHLEKGRDVMAAMAKKMRPGGLCFFTTAANAPAEDHILLFRTCDEIRSLLQECGWQIIDEHLGTLRGMSVQEAERDGHNINYAATITPRE